MAPTKRSTSLQNASKAFKTIIVSPASFIRKRLRRSSPSRNLKRALNPATNPACTHSPVGIGRYATNSEARALCDLFIEDAGSYGDWAAMFLDEVNDRLKATVEMWESALEVMKAGSGCSRNDLHSLREFHFKTLTSLSQMIGDVRASIWTRPRVKLSCRYHQDMDDVYFQIVHCHEDIRRLLGFICSYVEKCRNPTAIYGVKCRLDIRIKLREADACYERALESLVQTQQRFEEQLEQLFGDLRKTASSISDYLTNIKKTVLSIPSSV